MLSAFLITLLISKLSGGPEEIFMIPKLEKEIKSHVLNKDRKNEILVVAKEAKREIKTFGKLRKNKLNELEKLGKFKSTSSDQLYEIYTVYNGARVKMQKTLITKRLEMQQLLNEKEWKQLIEDAVLPSDKTLKKIDKQEEKEDDDVNKLIRKMEVTFTEEISEPDRRQNLMNSLEKFESTLKEFVNESQGLNFKDNKLVRNKNATQSDLENFYKKQNELRHKGTIEYFQLRDAAVKNTTEAERNNIVKSLMSIVKS